MRAHDTPTWALWPDDVRRVDRVTLEQEANHGRITLNERRQMDGRPAESDLGFVGQTKIRRPDT